MNSVNPTPRTWTIRFKYHKSTVLLHVNPDQSIESLKENLLYALRDVKPSPNFLNGRSPPSSISQIQLAMPRNALNVSEGWEYFDESPGFEIEDEDDGESKGKSKGKGKAKTESSGLTVREAGIRDNGVLAFRWRDEESAVGPGDADEPMEDGEWDVVIPTFDDSYGMENTMDSGTIPEREG